MACSGTTNVINATGLTVGNTYRVRVYSQGASPRPVPTGAIAFH